jgi:fumarate reductase subunit C
MEKQMSEPYVRPISAREWVFRHPRYVRYMVREFSCLFIGGWTVLMVWGLKALSEGPAAWAAFLQLLRSPAGIAFQLVTLAFALYHSVTWFNLTPKALPLPFIAAAHYAIWILLSAGVMVLAS